MPVIIPSLLPASETLKKEKIFVINTERAVTQDIRPLEVALVNLMPTKIVTETQILRMLSSSPIQINVDYIHPESYLSKNTSSSHMETFYKTFAQIKDKKYDGLIITGAPVEHLAFEEVTYWEELKKIMDYASNNVYSTLHICWGAQAGLYHYYGIEKEPLNKKQFGVFEHIATSSTNDLLRGFDDTFYVPHSRHTTISKKEVEKIKELEVLAYSNEVGLHLIATKDNRRIFAVGHSEYDRDTLKKEYDRDVSTNKEIAIPKNYFLNDDPKKTPTVRWQAHGNMFFRNWVNIIYQKTPFDINKITKIK